MFRALTPAAVCLPILLCLTFAVRAEFVARPDFATGDAEKGRQVYQRVGLCVKCHGWAGDGQAGRNPLSHADGANLRETKLDAQGLYDTIRCGVPGTQMPYHDSVSYRDRRCFGLLMSDFDDGQQPIMGKTFREKPMVDLIAYLMKYVARQGPPTYDDCATYYTTSAATACAYLRDK